MAVATALQPQVNGLPPRPLLGINETLEYQKILKIHDQVKAGSHPRLKSRSISHPQLESGSTPTNSRPVKENGTVPQNVSAVSQPHLKGADGSGIQFNKAGGQPAGQAPWHQSSAAVPLGSLKGASSELDPIFLTKSDDLVKAELQLQRQRAERVLREQMDQKRNDARYKPSLAESKPNFDVADVLDKALTLVKPVSYDKFHLSPENAVNTDSFDENSFYSSKAPDSASREDEEAPQASALKSQAQSADNLGHAADGVADRRHHPGLQQTEHRHDTRPAPQSISRTKDADHTTSHHPGRDDEPSLNVLATVAIDDDDDEPEYSPPEVARPLPYPTELDDRPKDHSRAAGARGNDRDTLQRPKDQRDESPLEADMQIVRSHIVSPAAPQPSRVSPLALSKGPPLTHERQNQSTFAQPRRSTMVQSLETTPVSNQPRKKRKTQYARRPRRHGGADSPEVVIKDEPVSPPPFHAVPPLGTSKQRQPADRPVYIDLEPPRSAHYPSEQRSARSPLQVSPYVPGQIPHSMPRVFSRSAVQDVSANNQDLRRVVTLHNLPAAEYTEAPYQTPTRVSRAPSVSVADRARRPRPAEEQAPLSSATHSERRSSKTLPIHQDVDLERAFEGQSYASAKPRRILVDPYGQRFYEDSQPARAPVAYGRDRRYDVGGYLEKSAASAGVSRAPEYFDDRAPATRYVREMEPPRRLYGRISDAPPSPPPEYRYPLVDGRAPREEFRYPQADGLAPREEVRYVTGDPYVPATARSQEVRILDHSTYPPAYFADEASSKNSLPLNRRPITREYQEPRDIPRRAPSVAAEAADLQLYQEDTGRDYRRIAPPRRPLYELRSHHDGDVYYRVDDDRAMAVDRPVEGRPTHVSRY